MTSSAIVHGGGWVTERVMSKPKAEFFGFVSVVWLFVAICGMFPFWDGWPRKIGWTEVLCGGLVLAEPVFLAVALFLFIREQPRVILRHRQNPNYDLRKLY